MNKPRLVGIIGATGTGKTTLCEHAERTPLPFIQTKVSDVYKDMGLNPKVPMSLITRLKIQTEILRRHEVVWRDQLAKFSKAPVILTDRSPICFMTYTLAEISGYENIPEETNMAVIEYLHFCRAVLIENFAGIFHLTGRPFAVNVADGKVRATTSRAYHEHYQALSLGLTTEHLASTRYHIDDNRLLDDRLISLKNFLGNF